ncbi:hypothetical protein JL722_12003 [Aureococcus anophagefferens]|nr:hypothetical protein JL722_12003 [Aureococcus anophagefferens]
MTDVSPHKREALRRRSWVENDAHKLSEDGAREPPKPAPPSPAPGHGSQASKRAKPDGGGGKGGVAPDDGERARARAAPLRFRSGRARARADRRRRGGGAVIEAEAASYKKRVREKRVRAALASSRRLRPRSVDAFEGTVERIGCVTAQDDLVLASAAAAPKVARLSAADVDALYELGRRASVEAAAPPARRRPVATANAAPAEAAAPPPAATASAVDAGRRGPSPGGRRPPGHDAKKHVASSSGTASSLLLEASDLAALEPARDAAAARGDAAAARDAAARAAAPGDAARAGGGGVRRPEATCGGAPPNHQRLHKGGFDDAEHRRFLVGIKLFGSSWAVVQHFVGSKNAKQLRSHWQKFSEKDSAEVAAAKAYAEAAAAIRASLAPVGRKAGASSDAASLKAVADEAVEVHRAYNSAFAVDTYALAHGELSVLGFGAAPPTAPSTAIATAPAQLEQAPLRRGKWTPQERAYACCVLDLAEAGQLPGCADNVTWCACLVYALGRDSDSIGQGLKRLGLLKGRSLQPRFRRVGPCSDAALGRLVELRDAFHATLDKSVLAALRADAAKVGAVFVFEGAPQLKAANKAEVAAAKAKADAEAAAKAKVDAAAKAKVDAAAKAKAEREADAAAAKAAKREAKARARSRRSASPTRRSPSFRPRSCRRLWPRPRRAPPRQGGEARGQGAPRSRPRRSARPTAPRQGGEARGQGARRAHGARRRRRGDRRAFGAQLPEALAEARRAAAKAAKREAKERAALKAKAEREAKAAADGSPAFHSKFKGMPSDAALKHVGSFGMSRKDGRGFVMTDEPGRISGTGDSKGVAYAHRCTYAERGRAFVDAAKILTKYALVRMAAAFEHVVEDRVFKHKSTESELTKGGWVNAGKSQGEGAARHVAFGNPGTFNGEYMQRYGAEALPLREHNAMSALCGGLTSTFEVRDCGVYSASHKSNAKIFLTPAAHEGTKGAVTLSPHRDCLSIDHVANPMLATHVVISYAKLNKVTRKLEPIDKEQAAALKLDNLSGVSFMVKHVDPTGRGYMDKESELIVRVGHNESYTFDGVANAAFIHKVVNAKNPYPGLVRVTHVSFMVAN